MNIIIGSRGSKLALRQTEWVKSKLASIVPGANIYIKKIKTVADKSKNLSLTKIEPGGLFTKEIEEALLKEEIDIAVHSMKDVALKMPEGLTIGAVPARGDPRDALISSSGEGLDKLPEGARIGTGSIRRKAFLLCYRRDLRIVELRGNIDTRLGKLASENLDAIILAAEGLIRLGWKDRITRYIPMSLMLPAAGQGALCLQIRKKDKKMSGLVHALNDMETEQCIRAERAFLEYLGGGCKVSAGVYAHISGKVIKLEGGIVSHDGSKAIRHSSIGEIGSPESAGKELARKLISSRGKSEL